MRKLAWLFVWLALVVVQATAQDAPPQDSNSQSTSSSSSSQQPTSEAGEAKTKKKVSSLFSPKYEIYAGFAHRSFSTTGPFPKVGMNGWVGSFDYNWKSWLGFMGEAQGVYTTLNFTGGGTQHPSVYALLGGPEVFPLKHHKVTPFGHFLYGEGYYRLATNAYGGFPSNVWTDFARSWEGGGGLDLHIKPNWSVRLIEFDYSGTHFTSPTSSSSSGSSSSGSNPNSQGSYRFSFGIVFYSGER